MESDNGGKQFAVGVSLCWLPIIILPAGLLAMGGGPCAGPRNVLGSIILLTAGAASVGLAGYGIFRIFKKISLRRIPMRILGVLSASVGCCVMVLGGLLLLMGIYSLESFLKY